MANPIPAHHQTLIPHLTCSDTLKAIEFYEAAFGAERVAPPSVHGGKVAHAHLRIGDCTLFLADSFEGPAPAPAGSSINICTADTDALFARAVEAGAKPTMPPMDAFWGDRYARLEDPFGHTWAISTRQRDLSPEEIERAAKAFFASFEGA